MKMGRSVPMLFARYGPFAGLGPLDGFGASAKSIATNAEAYAKAYARNPSALFYGGVPYDQALLLDSIPANRAEPPFTKDFLKAYFADRKSLINAQDGKPLSDDGRAEYFSKVLQWQLNNKTHPPLKRPMTVWHGSGRAAVIDAGQFAAKVAAAIGASYLLAPAAGGAAAAPAGSAAAGGEVAAGGGTVASGAGAAAGGSGFTASDLISTASDALDTYTQAKQAAAQFAPARDPGGVTGPLPVEPSANEASAADSRDAASWIILFAILGIVAARIHRR